MLFTPAQPSELLNWFTKEQDQFELLVLLIAGGVSQNLFFRDIFDQKENIDVISGPNIAVFLFGGTPQSVAGKTVGTDGVKLIIPGEDVGWKIRKQREDDLVSRWGGRPHYYRSARFFDPSADLDILRISDIHDSVREDIIRNSMAASSSLCDTLSISVNSIPCIALLSREQCVRDGVYDPIVTQTSDVASVKDFIEFLRHLRLISENIRNMHWRRRPDTEGVKAEVEEFRHDVYNALRAKYEDAKSGLNELVRDLFSRLKRQGMREDDLDRVFGPCLNDNLLDHLDRFYLAWLVPQQNADDAAEELVRVAIANDDDLMEIARRIRSLLRAMRPLRKSQRKLSNILKSAEYDNYRNLFADIDRLSNRFESKFFWRNRVQTLGGFVTRALGLAKTAKDIREIGEILRKIDGNR